MAKKYKVLQTYPAAMFRRYTPTKHGMRAETMVVKPLPPPSAMKPKRRVKKALPVRVLAKRRIKRTR